VRVGIIGSDGPDSFAENIGDGLVSLGHSVVNLGSARSRVRSRYATRVLDLARHSWTGLDVRAQRRICARAREAQCEFVINVDSALMPVIVNELRQCGITVVFWFPDHVANLGRQLMLLSPYNAIFFKDPLLVQRMRAMLDLPVYYLPEACNPRWHRPLVPPGTEPHLLVPANAYPYRIRVLERLIAKGIPLKMYGAGFPRWVGDTPARTIFTGRCVFREEKARAYRSAAGVLSTMHPAEMHGVNGRLFQAAGCGAAVLTEFRPSLPELFEDNQEVLAFRDFDELVDLSARLLNEAGLTARIGDAAASRAHKDHAYANRIRFIFEQVC
jgi:spore maturation protein CgeB